MWFEPADGDLDFNHEIVTAELQLEPTAAHRASEPRAGGFRWRRASWQFGVAESAEVDWDALVEPVLGAFRGRESAVQRLRHERGLIGGLTIVTELSAERTFAGSDGRDVWGVPTPAAGLSRRHLQDLARLEFSFQVDMYVQLPPPLEHAE